MLAPSPGVPSVLSDEVRGNGGSAIVCVSTQGGPVALTLGGSGRVVTVEFKPDQIETLAALLLAAARINP